MIVVPGKLDASTSSIPSGTKAIGRTRARTSVPANAGHARLEGEA